VTVPYGTCIQSEARAILLGQRAADLSRREPEEEAAPCRSTFGLGGPTMKKVKKKKSTPRRRRDSTSPQASSDSMQQPSSDSAQQPGSKATQIQSCLESTPRQQPCPRSTPQQPIPRALPLSETYYSSRSLLPSKADPSTTPPLRKTGGHTCSLSCSRLPAATPRWLVLVE
jgi:hypothetical protein